MQTVGNLDEDDTDVLAHGEQQLLEVLCLCRSLFAKDAATDLSQTVDDLRNLRAEHVFNVLNSIFGVFDHVVQQGSTDAGRP